MNRKNNLKKVTNALDPMVFLEDYLAERYSTEPYTSHHLDHLYRVRSLSLHIARSTNADIRVLEPAALLHDIGRIEDKPGDCHAEHSAWIAKSLLQKFGEPMDRIDQILYAIRTHRYSSGIVPETIEAQILQDADRLDALGAMGIVRVIGHGHSRPFYNMYEPFPDQRKYQTEFSMDYFYSKILTLKDSLHTDQAKQMAEKRHAFLCCFLEQLQSELKLAPVKD